MADLTFIGIMLTLHLVSFFLTIMSLIKPDQLIFTICAVVFLVIYHPMIIFILSKSFIVYLLTNNIFNMSKTSIVFNAKRK